MIVTRTPFRVTLGGGGTDLPSFYSNYGGYVLALGIDKYMYIALNVPCADRKIRLHYSSSEMVNDVRELKHDLAREALTVHGIQDCVEIASLADLPAGTGLGSSSAYLVGLLTAIRALLGKPIDSQALAEEACRIELDILAKPIGKQDQYMAAVGGLTELHIDKDGTVRVERVRIPSYAIHDLIARVHLYYTNVQRNTVELLGEQSSALRRGSGDVATALAEIQAIGKEIGHALRMCDFDHFGRLMHLHWVAKQRLSPRVSVSGVDALYDEVRRRFGVLGGKVAGAGGGGFLMLYCPSDGAKLTEFMAEKGMARLSYRAEFEGSKVIANAISASDGSRTTERELAGQTI